MSVEKYLKPEVIRQISRLDLRAEFIIKGFMQGMHASPFHGFSVEFSEHQKYCEGDDPADIDWLVFAKTDKYYIKKFEAETNITGYLAMDLSRSMGYTYQQEMTKFEYSICLAAALCYMMINQNDPVGLVTFGEKLNACMPPKSKRQQIGNILSVLANIKPEGRTNISHSMTQLASMLKHASLVILFSDLLSDPDDVINSLHRLRHAGHDIILFHILDEAEATFPFNGMVELEDPESHEKIKLNANSYRHDYLAEIENFRTTYRKECFKSGIDYVELDTSMPFDKALTEYLTMRRQRA